MSKNALVIGAGGFGKYALPILRDLGLNVIATRRTQEGMEETQARTPYAEVIQLTRPDELRSLLEGRDIEVAYVATPTNTHVDYLREFANLGSQVRTKVVEKPLDNGSTSFEELYALAKCFKPGEVAIEAPMAAVGMNLGDLLKKARNVEFVWLAPKQSANPSTQILDLLFHPLTLFPSSYTSDVKRVTKLSNNSETKSLIEGTTRFGSIGKDKSWNVLLGQGKNTRSMRVDGVQYDLKQDETHANFFETLEGKVVGYTQNPLRVNFEYALHRNPLVPLDHGVSFQRQINDALSRIR